MIDILLFIKNIGLEHLLCFTVGQSDISTAIQVYSIFQRNIWKIA